MKSLAPRPARRAGSAGPAGSWHPAASARDLVAVPFPHRDAVPEADMPDHDPDAPDSPEDDSGAASRLASPALKLVVGGARAHDGDDGDGDDPLDDPDRWAHAVARDQDREAFARLFTSVGPRLKAWLVRSGSTADVADEIVQDTFVVFWRKAAMFDASRCGVGGWLFAIARNLRIDRHRSRCDAWVALDDETMAALPDPEEPVEDRLTSRQRETHVRAALAQLPPEDREYLQWSYFDEKPHSLIARDLGIPLGTVKTRIRRAATRLRQLLERA